MKRIIVIMGPPNSGKGTYGEKIAGKLEILRMETGKIIKEIITTPPYNFRGYSLEDFNNGILLSSDLVNEMVLEHLSNCDDEVLLDGYPRTLEQINFLYSHFKNIFFVIINVAKEELLKRAENRRYCEDCNKIYALHNPNMQPDKNGKCIDCGGNLFHREDDARDIAERRIDLYNENFNDIYNYIIDNNIKNYSLNYSDMGIDNIVSLILEEIEKAR